MLDPAGPAASAAADLWWLMLGLGTAVFLLVVALLVIGFRRSPGPLERSARALDPARSEGVPTASDGADGADDPLPAGSDAGDDGGPGPTSRPDGARSWWLLGGGVLLPVVVVTVILVATVAIMATEPEAAPDDLTVEIVGHQYWWEVRYPDQGVVTANELHIPTGVPVRLALTSADVIHSFWVPDLAGKMDLLPERTNELIVQADRAGRFPAVCAEFCGLQHALMEIPVTASSSEDFESWLADRAAPAPEPTGEQATRGRTVLEEHCASCHTVRGSAAAGEVGPDLTNLAARDELGGGALAMTAENLETWILHTDQVKEGTGMDPVDLDPAEIDALVEYLLSTDGSAEGP